MLKAWTYLKLAGACFLILFPIIAQPSSIIADDLKWSSYDIPSQGTNGRWILAEGSDVRCPALSSDGTLYCYANPSSTTARLFKSTDGGYSWSYTGSVTEDIVDIAVSPANPQRVFYATASSIYKSTDAGDTFNPLIQNPGGSGTENKQIESLDIASDEGIDYIIAGTSDTDSAQFGGVYVLKDDGIASLEDTGIGNYDVYAVACSPAFADDHQIVAVVSDEQDTLVLTQIGNAEWNGDTGKAVISGRVPATASISFPSDYQSDINTGQYVQYLALDTGTGSGDVFRIAGAAAPGDSSVTDLKAGGLEDNVDFISLAVSGASANACLMAGASGSSSIYLSSDGGNSWSICQQPPSGDSKTFVLMAPDFADSGKAYAATSGPESAFSISADSGASWRQTGLVDTRIDNISDLAVSKGYGQDKTVFLVTAFTQNSLWRSLNDGLQWERIYHTTAAGGDRVTLVALSPDFVHNQKLFLAGSVNGSAAIWESVDSGNSFSMTSFTDPNTEIPVNIDTWAIAPGDALFIASFDGVRGQVYYTNPGETSYAGKASTGDNFLYSLAVSPDYTNDHTLLAGDVAGKVFYSINSGTIFEPLIDGTITPIPTGKMSVAFDPDYSSNRIIYAGSGAANEGIFRLVKGDNAWESMQAGLPPGVMIGKLVIQDSGILYAVDLQQVNQAGVLGGVDRCLNPAGAEPSFEIVLNGMTDRVCLSQIWVQGAVLWTIDITNYRLMTYNDGLPSDPTPELTAPKLISPKAPSLSSVNPTFTWTACEGAEKYELQVSRNDNFADLVVNKAGEDACNANSWNCEVPLEYSTGYYWRVRAVYAAGMSDWSAVSGFTTKNAPVSGGGGGGGPISVPSPTPLAAPKLSEPKITELCPPNPIFKWTAVTGAEKYELLVARDDAFLDMVISRTGENACNSNAWICDTRLDYDGSYYWKVRAIAGEKMSAWSEVSVITIEPAPRTTSPSPSPKTSPSSITSKTGTPKATTGSSPSATAALTSSTPKIAQVNSTVTPASGTASPTSPGTSNTEQLPITLLFFLVGGLIVLTGILIIVVVAMYRRFKKF